MKQIRLCWKMGPFHDLDDVNRQSTSCSGWESETAENAFELQLLCDAANRLYGAGSHWTEVRDMPGIRDWGPELDTSPPPTPPFTNRGAGSMPTAPIVPPKRGVLDDKVREILHANELLPSHEH